MNPMNRDWMIVDGYSLYHREPSLKKYLNNRLELGREHLVRLLEVAASPLADRVTVVFDGQGDVIQQDIRSSLIEVLFAPTHLTADSVIERMVSSAEKPDDITVVTNDYSERNLILATGGHCMSCGQLLDLYAQQMKNNNQQRMTSSQRTGTFTMGDLFP